MREIYIVYLKGGSKSLFESSDMSKAIQFVKKMESQNLRCGNPYNDQYEIVKVTRR